MPKILKVVIKPSNFRFILKNSRVGLRKEMIFKTYYPVSDASREFTRNRGEKSGTVFIS